MHDLHPAVRLTRYQRWRNALIDAIGITLAAVTLAGAFAGVAWALVDAL